MGLFKDFKEDFSQAVNELVPGGEELEKDNIEVDTLSEDVDVKSELSKLDGLLEQVKEEPVKPVVEKPVAPVVKKPVAPVREVKEERKVMETPMREVETPVVLDETSVITASTVLTGNIATAGSFDIQGTVNGNVSCNGKLVVTGVINGNSSASEFFADVAKIEGEVLSSGTVKIGAGSVIVGNITAASAVIAGAVKGDIDVQGPVVVDASAVIMGNIKSRSVQINNGAVIEGFCSQCYADIDVQGLFASK
ncbi:MAG: polymer-forming cytoskeletal protein [Agathobacter sp.]|nr:polymer-forming cytoskeletal protein [Agathobacter sp.]